MPKILFNAREQLLAEAKRQINEKGYAATTMRSVAGACGFAVGTMYNYFESKEALISMYVAEDWKLHLEAMSTLPTDCPRTLFLGMYNSIVEFIKKHERLFSDHDAAKVLHNNFMEKHTVLRDQLADIIAPVCSGRELEDPEFTAIFIAETILATAKTNTDFDLVYPILEKIIK